MKQYTTPEQTAKLIELGFEKPKFEIETQLCNIKGQPLRAATIIGGYSTGELIEMLPMIISKDYGYTLSIYMDGARWIVAYDNGDECCTLYAITRDELIDSLYAMIIKLKEGGVI